MFLQFRICPDQRDLLRFLWWENNDISKEPTEYRICVHLFGAASSLGCANFGLKQIAKITRMNLALMRQSSCEKTSMLTTD